MPRTNYPPETDVHQLPGPDATHWAWQLRAACRDERSQAFFPPDGERRLRRTIRENYAKAICEGCPVRAECLAHSLAARERYGVWGGLGELERRALLSTG
ncbi:MAG: WhiB family transcriptional regulator [Sciscionella sp.]